MSQRNWVRLHKATVCKQNGMLTSRLALWLSSETVAWPNLILYHYHMDKCSLCTKLDPVPAKERRSLKVELPASGDVSWWHSWCANTASHQCTEDLSSVITKFQTKCWWFEMSDRMDECCVCSLLIRPARPNFPSLQWEVRSSGQTSSSLAFTQA